MANIITEEFRHINCTNFYNMINPPPGGAVNHLYMYIGRSKPWRLGDNSPDAPIDGPYSNFQIRQNMMAIKKIIPSRMTKVIPRHNWESGKNDFTPYLDESSTYNTKFYCITDEYKIYKLIAKGVAVTANKPTHITSGAKVYADGHAWWYMGRLKDSDRETFANTNYIPVKTIRVDPEDPGTWEQEQWDLQVLNATHSTGFISRFVSISGGSNYILNNTTISTTAHFGVSGLGSITPIISNGAVTGATISTSNSLIQGGTGYKYLSAKVTGSGTGAILRPVFSPGHGIDIERELGATYIEVAVDLISDGNGTLPINDFRQLGLLLNPNSYGTNALFTGDEGSALKGMILSTTSTFLPDELISQQTSTAIGYVVDFNGSSKQLRYVQYNEDSDINCVDFTVGGGSIVAAENKSGTVSSLVNPAIDKYSGKILTLENRTQVIRSQSQTEKVHLIIKF